MRTHGKSNNKLYKVWASMKQRCYNKNDDFYYCYGGKGITICEEWKNNFQNFYEWAISNGYNENLTIDRINSNGNYCPENCRWANSSEQSRNRTDRKRYEFNGKQMLLSEISEITNIKVKTLWQRIKRGIPLEEPLALNRKKYVLIDNKFLYESATVAAQAIKDEIKRQLKVWDGILLTEDTGARYIEKNSALVSAQNRQRFYVHNCGEVEQPKDRGILLRDILESGVVEKDKGYCLKHQAGNARDYFKKHHTNIKFEEVSEPVCVAQR